MRNKRIQPPVPQDDRRGCLCWDTNTYSRECCDGDDYHTQGIGSIYGNILIGSSLTLTGFAVAQDGTITNPTSDIGTVSSVTPSSFSIVDTNTSRTVTVCVIVPEGYANTGESICTTDTVTQLATPTLACNDITFTGFAVSQGGVITTPSIDIGTISSTSPSSFDTVSEDTVRTLNVNVTVPSGYFNTGSTLACTTTATQPAIGEYTCTDVGTATIYTAPESSSTYTFSSGNTPTSASGGASGANTTLADVENTFTFGFTVPGGYSNAGETITGCSFNAYQPSHTKQYISNNLSGERTWRVTFKGSNLPDTSTATKDIVATGGITFVGYATPTVVSGDSSGITWTESSAIYNVVGFQGASTHLVSHRSDTAFTSIQTGSGNVSHYIVALLKDSSGSDIDPISASGVNKAIYEFKVDQQSGTAINIQKSNEQGYNTASNFMTTIPDGYYCQTSQNEQIRVQSGIITEYSTIT
jgi:hypothetical protein|tara:strand:+ start:414 stop:1826 length:1413 start_codon:yes stop_codon:yes gene_type:complete